jgi:hypothetical protein
LIQRFALAGALASAAVVLSACDSTTPAASAPPSSAPVTTSASLSPTDDKVVAWVDQVCRINNDVTATMKQIPQFDTRSLARIKEQYVDYLGKGSAASARGVEEVTRIRNGPHPDSEKVATAVAGEFGKLKQSLDTARSGVQAADPAKPEAFQAAMKSAQNTLSANAGTSVGPEKMLVESSLAQAAKKAASCQR